MTTQSNVRRLTGEFAANDFLDGQGLFADAELLERRWNPSDDKPRNKTGKRLEKTSKQRQSRKTPVKHHDNSDAPSGHSHYTREQRFIKNVTPRTEGQAKLLEAIDRDNLVLALGPAGTGKTYLAIAKAVEALKSGRVGRIVLCRPAVDAGENIGFLPGDMEEKLAPYLRPLYDALSDRLPAKSLKSMIFEGLIEIAPVGFMRGRTLNNAFVVIDEAQNCTYVQLKMLLTRLGWNSSMIVTGDPAQSDLLPGLSGLGPAAEKLENLDDISVIRLAKEDVVRHPLVAKMLTAL